MKQSKKSHYLESLFLDIGPGKQNEHNIREYIEYLIHQSPKDFTKNLDYFIRYLKNETDTKKRRVCAYRYNLLCSSLLEKYNIHRHKFILDELSISILDSQVYRYIHGQMVDYINAERYVIHEFFRALKWVLKGFPHVTMVSGRRKSILSIYGKILAKQDMQISSIRDIFAFRVIIEEDNPELCYALMNQLGKSYTFDVTRYKDYISIPKLNGYQSLHLGFMFESKDQKSFPIELQIRTRMMNEKAENGIAAHHIYTKIRNEWRFIDIHPLARPTLSETMIYCLSPDQDMILLRKSHSLRDFARAIHTKLPDQITGAYVNGIFRDISHELSDADQVQLI